MGNRNQKASYFISIGTIIRLFGILLLFAVAGAHSPAAADTWYVSTTGSDSNGGTGWGNAFGTIQRGIDEADKGDTVLVADGTYTGTGNKNITTSKEIEVRSVNGPNSSIIDLENEGKGFYLFNIPATSQTDLSSLFVYQQAWQSIDPQGNLSDVSKISFHRLESQSP